MISYLKHAEIEKHKWDKCIDLSPNGLANVHSWYLDITCPGWDALIKDDYVAVMPLPVKKKYLIKYLIQPLFIQQLGIFRSYTVGKVDAVEFVNFIHGSFKFININLNSLNTFSDNRFITKSKINQQLNLSCDYNTLYSSYSRGTKKSIRHSIKEGIQIKENISIETFLELKQSDPLFKVKQPLLNLLNILAKELNNRNMLQIFGAYTDSGKLCTSIMFYYDSHNIYLLMSATTHSGREKKAMFLIIDMIIKKFSGKSLYLNFAGSNMKGVHFFNNGFGAINTYYLNIKRHALPWPLSYFKSLKVSYCLYSYLISYMRNPKSI